MLSNHDKNTKRKLYQKFFRTKNSRKSLEYQQKYGPRQALTLDTKFKKGDRKKKKKKAIRCKEVLNRNK